MILRSMSRNAVVLGLFAVVGTALLALTEAGTRQRIADNEREALLRTIHVLVPPSAPSNWALYFASSEMLIVGQTTNGGIGTDTITGVNANTVSSTKYFSSVTSVVASATSANNVSVGYTADLALPRTRVKGLYYVGSGSSGTIVITSPNVTAPLYKIITPTSAGSFADSLFMPAEGILVGNDARNDYATVTATSVTSFTLLCG